MSRPRHFTSIRSRLARKLTTYSAALGAGLVAGDQVKANVMYTDPGPGGIKISGEFDLDINADGRRDFRFKAATFVSFSSYTINFRVRPQFANGVVRPTDGYIRLAAGAIIDPQAPQIGTNVPLAHCSNGYGFDSFLGRQGFLGLSFDIPGSGRHAGWVQIEAATQPPHCAFSPVIIDFAYETEPGKPILAGDIGVVSDHFGDTNADGKVDILDLNNVRNNFGATGDGVLGDTNSDAVVDIQDLNDVRNNFGAGNPVPEPPSLVLLAAGATGLAVLRRKRATRELC